MSDVQGRNFSEEFFEGDETLFEDTTLRVESAEGYASLRSGIINTQLNVGSDAGETATVVGPNGYNVRLGIRADDEAGTMAMTSNLSPVAARKIAAELEQWADEVENHREESEYFDVDAGKRTRDVEQADETETDDTGFIRRLIS
jgi:hypothetical protein